VFTTAMGTTFEAYNFILYGSLAPLFSRHFFSALNETAAFVFTLLTFAAGYLVRPLGALVFGSLGDRKGRKRAFLMTITLMGLATFSIGLLPSYESVGLLAPALLIALRLLQGLAFGGEYGGAVVYAGEHAPAGQRGLYCGWLQVAGGAGLFLSFLVVYLVRRSLGEAAFDQWGWRLPFLFSIVLMAVSLRYRLHLEETPAFRRMDAMQRTARRPVGEIFGDWRNLRLMLVILLGLMVPQGVIFYTAVFYAQFFLIRILQLPQATMTFIMLVVTLISLPFYMLWSWWSDSVGRKPLLLTGAALSMILMVPVFQGLGHAVNPALATASITAPVLVTSDSQECSWQFDPVEQAAFASSCDIAKSALTLMGVSYRNAEGSPGTLAVVQVGTSTIQSVDGRALGPVGLAVAQRDFQERLSALLTKEGYVLAPDPARANLLLVTVLLLLLVLPATMVYALGPLMAFELIPTRIRYTGLSLPFHIGSGWFGGFLPAIAFAMAAANGNPYFGLWYPLVATVLGVAVLLFLIPETRGRPLS